MKVSSLYRCRASFVSHSVDWSGLEKLNNISGVLCMESGWSDKQDKRSKRGKCVNWGKWSRQSRITRSKWSK